MKEICFCYDSECFNTCFWISTFIVPFITFIVVRCLRPKLKIEKLQILDDKIKVDVINKSCCCDANNLRIEICAFDALNNQTYHFEPDHTDFLILPHSNLFRKRDNLKTFVCRKAASSAIIVLNDDDHKTKKYDPITGCEKLLEMIQNGYKVRVRCHAYHSFSGLGKSFEKVF